jgi:hypothetical protein
MMAIVPDKYLDLLQRKKAFAIISTVMPDGSPQVTPGLVRLHQRDRSSEHRARPGQGAHP